MFSLVNVDMPHWPKLGWVAEWEKGSANVVFMHGPMVEIRPEWAVEAIWVGDFESGDFDRTENVFGTGVRIRGNSAVFVSSGHTFDRLLYVSTKTKILVSNTLPGLLSVSDLELKDDYQLYSKDAVSMTRGLDERDRFVITNGESVQSIYYNNLSLDLSNGNLSEINKVDTAPYFDTFETYRDYLFGVSKSLGINAADSRRKYAVHCLTGISSGYDSSVAAVVARAAGCKDAVTISSATSLWSKSDSGAEIAKHLDLNCKEYPRTSKHYPNEVALWAGEGRPGVLNWTLFGYPEPLCLFFTGCHGEKVWDRVNHDHPDPFVRRDSSSHGFCEYRLVRGVFQCPVPFFGVRHVAEIRLITSQVEMREWYMNQDYDKPIARRILEDAGVPRSIFGTSNKNTSLEAPFRWPISPDSKRSFEFFLKKIDINPMPSFMISIVRNLLKLRHLFYMNFGKYLGWKHTETISQKVPGYNHVYQWANHTLRDEYYK